MYNLLVSSDKDEWSGDPFIIEEERCVREYTDKDITKKYGKLDSASVNELKRFPCIFGYEAAAKKAPRFGVLKDVTRRQGKVRIEYTLKKIDPFLSADDLSELLFELDIGEWELNRTHWAVKDVNLPKELKARGIRLPAWAREISRAVDITTHQFDVGLSFPGEARSTVEQVARELERRIGPDSCFYDENYVSQLARPSLDSLLQNIYRNRSKLVAIFLSGDYQRKEWCGIEFRAIKEIIMEKDHRRIMLLRMDDSPVDGVFKTDGYVDARRFTPEEIASFIEERVRLL